MREITSSASGGLGPGTLLGVVFIVLKLTHVIDWSWLWVLSPFWIPLGIVAIVLLIMGIVAIFTSGHLTFKKRRNRR